MAFGKDKGDPTARRRRAPDDVLAAAQEVIRRHGAGESARSIARGLGLSRTSVDRIIAEYKAAQAVLEAGVDVDSEYQALVSKYEGGINFDDARTVADVMALDDLQYWRLQHGCRYGGLDDGHPARVAHLAALATGWRRQI